MLGDTYFHERCTCPTATVAVNGHRRDVVTHYLPDCPGALHDRLMTRETFIKIPDVDTGADGNNNQAESEST